MPWCVLPQRQVARCSRPKQLGGDNGGWMPAPISRCAQSAAQTLSVAINSHLRFRRSRSPGPFDGQPHSPIRGTFRPRPVTIVGAEIQGLSIIFESPVTLAAMAIWSPFGSLLPVILAATGIWSPFPFPTWFVSTEIFQLGRQPVHPARLSWHNRLGT